MVRVPLSRRFGLRMLPALLLTLSSARGADPVDDLLRLAPADSGLTIVVEDLKGQARSLLDSPLATRFRALPAYREWIDSGGGKRFQQARTQIERALGVTTEQLRDDVLGEAVVLALRSAPGEPPEEARGLLLTRVRDRAALDALIERLNAIERAEGSLDDLVESRHRQVRYTLRRFVADSKPTEAYTYLGDSVFAWSNSEAMIRDVIDRHLDRSRPSLGTDPEVQAIRSKLPPGSLVQVLADARRLAGWAEAEPAARSTSNGEAFIKRYLGALRYVGVALELRGGILVHMVEQVDPDALDAPLRRWAASDPGETGALLDRVPPRVATLARAHVHAPALAELAIALIPDDQKPRVESFLGVLRGLLLGHDVLGVVVPALGPSVVAFVREPEQDGPGRGMIPIVIAITLMGNRADPAGVPAALDNALRTLLHLAALEAPPGHLRVETTERSGARVTSLVGRPIPLAYAVGPGFLALGTSAEALADFAGPPAPRDSKGSGNRLARVRAAFFPEASSFLVADLEALGRMAESHREAILRRLARDNPAEPAEIARDFDRALGLIGLFRAAFATQTIDEDFRAVRRTIGLVTDDPIPAF